MNQEPQFQSIGKYRIIGTLGRGSMGIVYKGQDPEIGRIVAIKTLRKITSAQFHDADAALERFKVEARSAGNLRHPNIIMIFDVNVEGDTPYIVMDYVEGESLDIVLNRDGRFEILKALHYLDQIASGLDAAHDRGIIHRDIKPSNLMVDSDDRVYILDFGVAKINESISDADKLIQAEPVMGTPGYMSPEQILNEKLDPRTDLFSFAIVAFEFFTGRRPFGGENFTEVVGNILNKKALSITQVAPDLPLALEVEFERALAKKRADRFETAHEMVSAFKRACGVGQNLPPISKQSSGSTVGRNRKESNWKSLSGKTEPQPSDSVLSKRPNVPISDPAGEIVWNKRDSAVLSGIASVLKAPHRKEETTPGDLFSHVDGFGSKQHVRRGAESSPVRIFLAVLVIALFGAGLMLLLYPMPGTQVGDTAIATKTKTPVQRPSQSAAEIDVYLEKVRAVPVPEDRAVSEMSDPEVISVLLDPTLPEAMVLEALKVAQERSAPKLVDASIVPLESDSYIVRISTIKMLAEIGDRRIVPQLVLRLDDHDPLVRGHAARALGQLGSRASVGYLTVRFYREEIPEVKQAIRNAIERINGYPMEVR